MWRLREMRDSTIYFCFWLGIWVGEMLLLNCQKLEYKQILGEEEWTQFWACWIWSWHGWPKQRCPLSIYSVGSEFEDVSQDWRWRFWSHQDIDHSKNNVYGWGLKKRWSSSRILRKAQSWNLATCEHLLVQHDSILLRQIPCQLWCDTANTAAPFPCNCFFIPYGASILTRKNPWRSFSELPNTGFPKLCSKEYLLQSCEMLVSVKWLPVLKKGNIYFSKLIMYTRNFQEREIVCSSFLSFFFFFFFFELQSSFLHGKPIASSRCCKRYLSLN